MSIVLTSHANIKDWKELRFLHETLLLAKAKGCGATRYGVYRNVNNAAQVLLIAEFGEDDQLREFLATWLELSTLRLGDTTNDGKWEPLGWAMIP